jgi:hypothetical protein
VTDDYYPYIGKSQLQIKTFKDNSDISEATCRNIKSDKKLVWLHPEVEGTNVKHLKTLQSKLLYNWE